MSSNPIDVHVGARVRLRRHILSMSLEKLAAKIGVTYQQLQKYERAANRISASRLYTLAQALKVPVSYFFEDVASAKGSPATAIESDVLARRETAGLIRAYYQISDTGVRRQIVGLMNALGAPAKASGRRREPRQVQAGRKAA